MSQRMDQAGKFYILFYQKRGAILLLDRLLPFTDKNIYKDTDVRVVKGEVYEESILLMPPHISDRARQTFLEIFNLLNLQRYMNPNNKIFTFYSPPHDFLFFFQDLTTFLIREHLAHLVKQFDIGPLGLSSYALVTLNQSSIFSWETNASLFQHNNIMPLGFLYRHEPHFINPTQHQRESLSTRGSHISLEENNSYN